MVSFFAAPAPAGIVLGKEHAWVLLVAVASILVVNVWMSVRVGKARKAHGVTYPAMSGPDAFNCVVRGHLNTLENQPAALTLLLLAALFKPCGSAMAGAVWVVGRVVYFLGYSSGRPAARAKGAFNHFGQLAQMWIVVAGAVKLLRA